MNGPSFRLRGTGIGLPSRKVLSEDFDRELGKSAGWLELHCGVRERFVCGTETQDALAAVAARQALAEAGLDAADVDLLIFASAVPKQPIPSTAPLIARQLGIPGGRCAAFDINSTCLSFLSGVDVATTMLAAGRYRCVLIVSSEIATRALPWQTDPATAGLFGDGAAAAVLTAPVLTAPQPERASHVRGVLFETYPEGYEACQLAAGGTGIDFHKDPEKFALASFFQMNGHELFKLAAAKFPAFVDRLLASAQWRRDDVDLIVPHQASPLALRHLVKRCGFPKEKVIDIVASHGNQVAASIPTALHLARQQRRIAQGSKIILLGTSAGISFGGMAIEV